MKKLYSCYLVKFETLPINWMENSNIFITKRDRMRCWQIDFQFYKNQKLSEIHEICYDIMKTYRESIEKKLRRFCKSWHVYLLRNEVSPKKFHSSEKYSLRLWVRVTFELGFHFINFFIANRHDGLCNVKFW